MKSYNAVKSGYDLQKDARKDANYLCHVDRRQVDRHGKEDKTAHPRVYVHSAAAARTGRLKAKTQQSKKPILTNETNGEKQ